MAFSEEQLDRMGTDPALRRRYFWQVGQKAILRSHKMRKAGLLIEAQREASFGRSILDRIDALVETTGVEQKD